MPIHGEADGSAAWVVWYAAPLTPARTQASHRQKSMDAQQALLCVPGHVSRATGPRGSHSATGGRRHRLPDVSTVLTEPYAKTLEQNQPCAL
jgi:hypothetical protein